MGGSEGGNLNRGDSMSTPPSVFYELHGCFHIFHENFIIRISFNVSRQHFPRSLKSSYELESQKFTGEREEIYMNGKYYSFNFNYRLLIRGNKLQIDNPSPEIAGPYGKSLGELYNHLLHKKLQ